MTFLSFVYTVLLISSPSNRGVTTVFAPRNKAELNKAVDACLKLSPVGNCSAGPHGPIGSWDVSAVTSMYALFAGASSFNQDLSAWHVSAVTSMKGMFAYTNYFNQDLSAWDVAAVRDMNNMFNGAQSFNQDLSAWDVAAVRDMNGMFVGAHSFNQDLSAWHVSAVTDMQRMFQQAYSFNQDLSAWDVAAVRDMSGMFSAAHSFDKDLSAWDVSAVTTMWGMFANAYSFNQELSTWNVSAVTIMSGMFVYADSFNQNLSTWDVASVTDMSNMFRDATSFDQILCGVSWVNSKARKDNMFTGSSGSISSTACTSTTTTTVTRTTMTTTSTTTTTVTTTTPTTTAVTTTTAVATIATTTETPAMNVTTTATIAIAGFIIIVLLLVVVMFIRRFSNMSSGGKMQSVQVPLITTNDAMTPNYDPIFTSPTHYTDPSIQVMEEKSSNTDPTFTSPSVETDPSTTVVEESSSNAYPAFTSPAAETDPSTTVVEETNSNTNPTSTSPTDGANPSTGVVPLPSRTFNTSNYKRFYTGADAIGLQQHLLIAVESMLTLYAKRINVTEDQDDAMLIEVGVMSAMIQIQDDAFKHDEAMKNDIDAMAEYLWTSCKKLSVVKDMELCSVINAVIRDDVAEEIEAATMVFRSINSRRIRRRNVHASINVQSYPPKGETWRGGGFRREHRAFFERMIGKKYRVPGFLATSVRRDIAAAFAFKADMANPSHPCAIWCITFDPRGKENPDYRVKHMTLVSKTLTAGEHEYLFAPYSVFTLVSVKWSVHDAIKFTIRAARDNKEEDECLPLTPWY